jgi:hypothetical protein
MHHPTDLMGSMIGAAGCLAFALLATRTGVAVSEANAEADAAAAATATALPVAGPTDASEAEVAG